MKLNKTNYIHIAVLLGLYLIMAAVITRFTYAYGSDLDWSAQHFAIPDNFRREFYDSGTLFPSFIFNIGAGENIYNLSYYGLYSPIILLSYLFPFVPMYIYIQIVSILGVCASILLFYRWINPKFGSRSAFVLTVLFEFSTGFSLHSHRHIMFVSYMPFLLLAFNAVDNYFRNRRKYCLVIYTFLCIMCCYFFGVAAVAAIVVYGIYEYLRITEKVTLADLLKKGSHFAGRIITAVMMSGILLLPTVYCMLSGRDEGNTKIDLSTLVPDASIDFFCYDTYGMGLTFIAIIAVISAVFSKNKKHIRYLGIVMLCMLTLPAFVFALNGTLYIDAKVLIPFMPLCLLLVGRAFEQVEDKSFNWKLVLPLAAACVAAFWLFSPATSIVKKLMIPDLIATALIILVYLYFKKRIILQTGFMTVAVIAGFVANYNDDLAPLSQLDYLYSDDMYELTRIISEDEEVVRTANLVDRGTTPNYVYNDDYNISTIYSSLHNKKYNSFYFDRIYNENEFRNPALTTQSQNLLYQMYMGEKYLISDKSTKPSSMYKEVARSGELVLYKCDCVMPVGFCSSDVLSEEAFLKIDYPDSLYALLNNTVVENGGSDKADINGISPAEGFEISGVDGITKTAKGYSVRLEKTTQFDVDLKQPIKPDELLLVSFDVDNDFRGTDLSSDDAKVFIDGIKNNLTDPDWKYYNNNKTFEFVISSHDDEPVSELKLKFMKGNYDISNIRFYTFKLDSVKSVDKFVFDKQKTKGDNIEGSIDVTEDGYFELSVPYTEGFTATVDGEKTEVECVDTAFIGFPLTKGHHEIKITFTAPYKKAGLMMSAGGLLILAVLIVIERLHCRKKTEEVEK